jgi:hypothetical protein
MKSREEVAAFVNIQLARSYICTREKGTSAHYGVQELRELMDFVYEGEPKSEDEMIGI